MLLDPKLDVVFKLLFALPDNEELLRAMLTAVLEPATPIHSLTVLNPELPKDLADDKGVVLDIRVDLASGMRLDVEMESWLRPAFPNRVLYYWAKLYTSELQRGEGYTELLPAVSVVWLNAKLTEDSHLHSVFQLLERSTHTRWSEDLELHLLELPKLATNSRRVSRALRRWARFLRARTELDYRKLAQEDPIMNKAKQALEKVSRNPGTFDLVAERQRALDTYWIEMTAARKEGHKEGHKEGRADGEAKAILAILETRGLAVSAQERARILACTELDQLEKWVCRAVTVTTVPELFV